MHWSYYTLESQLDSRGQGRGWEGTARRGGKERSVFASCRTSWKSDSAKNNRKAIVATREIIAEPKVVTRGTGREQKAIVATRD